jgi:hypothetical protein
LSRVKFLEFDLYLKSNADKNQFIATIQQLFLTFKSKKMCPCFRKKPLDIVFYFIILLSISIIKFLVKQKKMGVL